MKRWIWILPLLAMPAFAQEEEKKTEPREVDPAKLIERIKAAEPEERARLLEELNRLLEKVKLLDLQTGGDVILEVQTQTNQEKITGSWAEGDDVSGKYTLTSLGKSRYRLEAERTGPEGEVTKIRDEGTLAELRKKYSFINNFAFVAIMKSDGPAGVPAEWVRGKRSSFPFRPPSGTGKARAYRMWQGLKLRRPSEDLEYHLKLPTETTWIVESISPGSKGEKLGLKKMDLLMAADGEDLAELKTLEKAKESLEVLRRGKATRVSLQAEK